MSIKITQKTTTYGWLTGFEPYVHNGHRTLHFVTDFGNGDQSFDARIPSKVFFGENASTEVFTPKEPTIDQVILFKITIEPKDGKWHITSLVRDHDNHEFVPQQTSLIAQLLANRGNK